MKNELKKILLYTICCAILYCNHGYSMIGNNKIESQQNDSINKISITDINTKSDCESLKEKVKRWKYKNCDFPSLNDTYNNFKSIKAIIYRNSSSKILHNHIDKQKYTKDVYSQFANNKYNEKSITELVNKLLQDSIKFSIKYSPDCQGMNEQNSSYQLFGIAWYILYKYSVNNKFKALHQKIELLYDNFLQNISISNDNFVQNISISNNNFLPSIIVSNDGLKIKLQDHTCIRTILQNPIIDTKIPEIDFHNYVIANYLKFYKNNKIPIKQLINDLYLETMDCYNYYKYRNHWDQVNAILGLAWLTLIQYIRDTPETNDSYDIINIEILLGEMGIDVRYNDSIVDSVKVDTDINLIGDYIKHLKNISNKNHQRIMMTPYLYNKYSGLSHIIHSVTNNKPKNKDGSYNDSYLDGCHVISKKALFYYEHENTYAHQFTVDLKDFKLAVQNSHYNKNDLIDIANKLLQNTLCSITENSYRKDWVFTAAWQILIQSLNTYKYNELYGKVMNLYNIFIKYKILDIDRESELINKYQDKNLLNQFNRTIMFSIDNKIIEDAKEKYEQGRESIQRITRQQCFNQYKSLQDIISTNILNCSLTDNIKLLCNARIFESKINNKINNNYEKKYECNIGQYDYGQHEDSIINYLQMAEIQLLANNLLRDNLLFISKYNILKNKESYKLFYIAWNTLLEHARVFRNDMYETLLKMINGLSKSLNIKINSELFKDFYCEDAINNICNGDNIELNFEQASKLAKKLRENRKTIGKHLNEIKYTENDIENTMSSTIMFNQFNTLKAILHNMPRFNKQKLYYQELSRLCNNFDEWQKHFDKGNTNQTRDRITWYISELLRDNLSFISKYSTNSNSYYLFNIAWNILFKWIKECKINIKNLDTIYSTFAIPTISLY